MVPGAPTSIGGGIERAVPVRPPRSVAGWNGRGLRRYARPTPGIGSVLIRLVDDSAARTSLTSARPKGHLPLLSLEPRFGGAQFFRAKVFAPRFAPSQATAK